ncbi:glutamyl-tRNA(Gln) amidotransferase subunit F [Maudiozyma exigua]|uniref:Glutamyl-tRNA(Gln) amidotransferase subunit F, mitochondrial n=1 Tax=Maudiozyma exigua TaxID=34358 RepID=A0A9P6W954_MAUEX|nr:glutamyl-tRNA(Gln) amidotransferase subunit F [Kazachstania exigua]
MFMNKGRFIIGTRSCQIKPLQCSKYSSSKVSVGSKFTSMKEIKEYLDTPSWSLLEYLRNDTNTEEITDEQKLPSVASVKKLLKLSGFDSEGVDIPQIQQRLAKQLIFLQNLQRAPLDDSCDNTAFARIQPRTTKPINYKDLLQKIEDQKNNKFEDEVSGYWNPLANNIKSKNGYFIVTKKTT